MRNHFVKKILVLVNSSDASLDAVRYATLIASENSCEIHVLFVVDTATLRHLAANKFFLPQAREDFEQELKSDGEKFLERAKEIGAKKGFSVHTHLKDGAVWSETVSMADKLDAQILLLGATQHSDMDNSDIFSSTYKKIIMNANCSVLIVKQKDIENIFKNFAAN